MEKERVKNITYISLCAAIMAVISQIAIPVGTVPLTIQVFAVALIGYFLGVKNGFAVILVYVLLGLVGAPVFAGFQGGFQVLISYTGGFIFGYLPFVCLCGIKAKKWASIGLGVCGLLACHLMGAIQYMLLSELSLWGALIVVSLPFLLKDIALVIGAYFVARILQKRLKTGYR